MSEHVEHMVSDWFSRQLGCLWTPAQLAAHVVSCDFGTSLFQGRAVTLLRRGDLSGEWWEVRDVATDKWHSPPKA